MNKAKLIITICIMAVSLSSFAQNREAASTQTSRGSEGFFMRNGQVMYIKGGVVNALQSNQTLADGTRISTNGKIDSPSGGHGVISNELIGLDGKKTGTIINEYITVKNGKAVIMTNEIATPIEEDMKVSDGVVIRSDGTLSNGSRVQEGAKVSLNGQPLSAGGNNGEN